MTVYPKQRLTAAKFQGAVDAAVAAAMAEYAPPTPVEGASTAPRRLVLTQRPTGFRGWDTPGVSDDQTFAEIRTILGSSGWFRLGFFYDIQDGECAIAGALMAQSASEASPINPVDEAGAPAPWVTVTFNNGGADVSLSQQLETAYTTAVSPVTTIDLNTPALNASEAITEGLVVYTKQNGVTWSDWMRVPPYRRTDGGAFNLLLTRVKFTGTVSAALALSAAYDAEANGRFSRAYINAGDCVTTPGNFVSTTRATLAAGLTVQYLPQSPSIQVAVTGDSTLATVVNHIALACLQLSTTTVPIEFCSTAKGGLSASEYADMFRSILPAVNPSIMFIETWSPNAGKNLAEAELGWAKNMQIAADVMKAGGVPVLMAPFPCPDRITTAGEEAVRLNIVARCLAARTAGMRVMDLNALMSAGETPVATIKPEYSTDGVHPTQDGQALIAAQATVPMLRSILNI